MSSRSLNKVLLIGNIVADLELRQTSSGTSVTTFILAVDRSWKDQTGQQKKETEFVHCVAWARCADTCAKILHKGRKTFVEGRLQTREWETPDKTRHQQTEIVVDNMIALDDPLRNDTPNQ